MNLSQWSSLAEEERRQLILDWSKSRQAHIYEDLACEAARRLSKEFAGSPDISLIEVGGGEILIESPISPAIEPVLNVCTMLPGEHEIAQLPSHYAGFRVRQVNLGDRWDAYIRTWKRLFKELNGWSEETTLAWAEKHRGSMKSNQSPIYSHGPVRVALPNLIDDSVRSLVGPDLINLLMSIRSVIAQTGGGKWPPVMHPDEVPGYDWEYVRRRIKELTERYTAAREGPEGSSAGSGSVPSDTVPPEGEE